MAEDYLRKSVLITRRGEEKYAIPYHLAVDKLYIDLEGVCREFVFGKPEKYQNNEHFAEIREKFTLNTPQLSSIVKAYGLKPLRRNYCDLYKMMKKDMQVRIEAEYRRNRTKEFKPWSKEWVERNQQQTAERIHTRIETELARTNLKPIELKALTELFKNLVYAENMIIGKIRLKSKGTERLPVGLKQADKGEYDYDQGVAKGTEIDHEERKRLKDIAAMKPDFTKAVGKRMEEEDA